MTAIGAWLRFTDIGTESLWADELYSVHWANKTVAHIFDNASSDVHPPSYYLLLHFWVRVVGSSEAAVRGLSALLSVLTIPLIAVLGQNLYAIERYATGGMETNHRTPYTANRRAWQTGLIAAWILTFSHFHIYYAQEARNYALTALCVVWAMIGFVRVLASFPLPTEPTSTSSRRTYRHSVALYVVSNILMMHTHFFALFVIVAQNAFIASLSLTNRSHFRAIVRHWLYMQCALLLLFTPWLRILLYQILRVGTKGFWIEQPTAFTLAETFAEYAGGVWLLGVLAVLIALGFWTAERSKAQHEQREQRVKSHAEHAAWVIRPNCLQISLLLTLWLSAPIIIPFVQSLVSEKSPTYYIKYTIAALPAFVLLAARGFASLPVAIQADRIRSVRLMLVKCVIVAAIALFSFAAVRQHWSMLDKERWRETAQILDAQAKTQDAIVVHQYYYEWALRYYCRAEHPVVQPVPSQFLAFRPNVLTMLLQPLTERHERVWLVLAQKDGKYGELIEYLRSQGYTLRSKQTISSFYRKYFTKDTFAHADHDQTVIALFKTYWTPHIQLQLFERKPLHSSTNHK
jgi:uncharacterized membrane protein